MDPISIVQGIEATAFAEWLRNSIKAVPIIEAVHVMAVATVFGTILIVDLRLLGYPNTSRPVSRYERELLRWTWGAFVLAAITGALMFVANAQEYYENIYFRWKMAALLAAGANMAWFQFVTYRSISEWDQGKTPPLSARMAGGLSILIWTSVIFLGRWIGFTKAIDSFEMPEDLDLDFDFLEGSLHLLREAATAFA